MKALRAVVLLLALAAAACGAGRPTRVETAADVASLIRHTWGETKGSPTFDYTCARLDDEGHLFTCLARDPSGTVRLASFDVVCDGRRCTWTDYPSYVG